MKYILLALLITTRLVVFGQELRNNYSSNDRYALIIGISKYQNSANDLNFAQKDAEDFSGALSKFGLFKKENIKLLVNNNASRENIRRNIEGWLKNKAKKDDDVIIFFSGHGAQIPDTDNDENDGLDECLVPYDFDNQDYSSLITDDIFAYWIRNLHSENVLIIFDNCFSGGAAKAKGVRLNGVKGNLGKDNFMKDISRELPKKGTALLAASKAEQVSFESSEFKNGIFTHFLLESIEAASDNDLNNIVSARELFYATKEKTLEYSKTKFSREQEPIFLDLLVNDIDIFYLPTKKNLPTSVDNKTIEKLKYQARQTQDNKEEIEIYQRIYELDPEDAGTISHLASLYESNKNYEGAIKYYKLALNSKSINSYSFNPPLKARISDIYQKLNKLDVAISYLEQGIKDNPSSPTLYNKIADLYLLTHDTLNAIKNLNKSLTIQPLQKEPYLTAFFIHSNLNNIEAANSLIEKSNDINSNDFGTQYCYYLSQKYISKIDISDSIFTSIELNSGIKKRLSEVSDFNSNRIYVINGRNLSKQETQLYIMKNAIEDYPYYSEFYKVYIQYVVDNKLDENLDAYKAKYLYYSILNPDKDFIKKYFN